MYQNIGDLTCIKKLGEGSFGKVGLYKQNNSNNVFAVKIINKLKAKYSNNFKYLNSELNTLRMLNHNNIAKLIKVIDNESQKDLILVMEYCHGYSLFDCLKYYKEKYKRPFIEEIVQYLARQIL